LILHFLMIRCPDAPDDPLVSLPDVWLMFLHFRFQDHSHLLILMIHLILPLPRSEPFHLLILMFRYSCTST
jgi:hypothetical protein